MFTQALLAAGGLLPVAVMLLLLFAAFWLHDERRERETGAPRSRS